MTKKEARKYYRRLREELTDEQYESYNQRIVEAFSAIDLSRVFVIHVFLSIKSIREPDTSRIIAWLRANHPDIMICVPRADMDGGHMDNVIYDEDTILEPNELGIPEPVNGQHLDAKLIDLAIIPTLGFDVRGNRVGYGKGFYDRFLKYCRPDVKKLGLCFFDPIISIDDTTQFDVPLNSCITAFHTYVF
jgi:5-formyltetrahydrofolate cyclo-ligase